MASLIAAGLGPIIEAVGKVAGDLYTTEKERRELDIRDREVDQRLDLAQIEVNKVEAASNSLFTSGWRPAIGWTCAISLFCYYVPYVLAATVLWGIQVVKTGTIVPRPDLGIADLIGLVASMLGMATLRHREKIKGAA